MKDMFLGIDTSALARLGVEIKGSNPAAGEPLGWAEIEQWASGEFPSYSQGYTDGWEAAMKVIKTTMNSLVRDKWPIRE